MNQELQRQIEQTYLDSHDHVYLSIEELSQLLLQHVAKSLSPFNMHLITYIFYSLHGLFKGPKCKEIGKTLHKVRT
jgi:hypothetical protein